MKKTTLGFEKAAFLFCIFLLSFSSLRAQCIIGNDEGSFDPQNNFFWGQSFTVECDGVIEYVEWLTGGPGTQEEGTLVLFSGETVTGTPFYTQEYEAMSFDAANQSLRITLDAPIEVTAGNIFTFETRVTTDLLISTANPYDGGIAFENDQGFAQVDFVFNVSISDNLGLEELSLKEGLSFYPNPAEDHLFIDLGRSYASVEITTFNILGDIVFQKSYSQGRMISADMRKLPAGVYLVQTTTANENAVFKFVKK